MNIRLVYEDITVIRDGAEIPSLVQYVPSEAKYAAIRNGDGWLAMVEAPEGWHIALQEIGFVPSVVPEILSTLEFVEGVEAPWR